MKKLFTQILTIVCCLAASLTVNAQYSKVLEAYPSGYTPTLDATFELSAVASTLGTDAATLATALNAETWSTPLFFVEDAEGTRYSDYTQGGNGGFWMNAQAVPVGWTNEVGDDVWYNIIAVDEELDAFTISIGQHPDALQGGEELKAKFILAFNEKEATFDITLKIKVLDIPETPNVLSKLNIIEKMNVEVHQWARSSNYAEADTIDFKGIAEKLGTTPETFSAGITRIVFATTVDNSEGLGVKSDTLTNVSTYNTPGWWFTNTNDTPLFSTFVSSADGEFSVSGFTLNPETEQLIFSIGQKGGALPIDGSDQGLGTINEVSTPIYFVYDGKAVELTVKLVIDERDKVPFSEMTEVGSEDVNLSQYPTTDYSSVSFDLDLDAIAALLEVDPTEITLWAAISDDISDQETATKGGFWFNKEGYSAGYGSNSGIYVEPDVAGDFSKFQVGQYPNAFSGGDEAHATIYLVAGSKYYKVNITMTILTKEGPSVEFESVATRAVKIQIVPANSYAVEMGYNIDPADLELIGTDSPTLYAQKAPAEGSEWVDGEYSDSYSCTPYPGFWMSAEGFAATWGSSPWGFTYSNDELYYTFYQMPNQNKVGDEYNAVVYLVNEQTGKMITYNMNIKFVGNVVPQAEIVGLEALMLPVAAANAGMTSVTMDIKDALEKLGLTEVSQLSSLPSLSAPDAEGNMSEPFAFGDILFNENGYLSQDANGEDAALYVGIQNNGGTEVAFIVYNLLPAWEKDQRINSRIGFQYESKMYIYNVSFVSEEVYTGIQDTRNDKHDTTIFDLSGRRVEKVQHGIYIQGGKKVVVK